MTRPAGGGLSRHWLALWGPVVVYAALILIGSAMPQPPAITEEVSDRALHAVGYAGLSLLILRALAGSRRAGLTRARAVLAAGSAFGYGLAIETVQWFLPERFFEVADLVANALGAALGVAAGYLLALVLGGRRSIRRASHDDIPSADLP